MLKRAKFLSGRIGPVIGIIDKVVAHIDQVAMTSLQWRIDPLRKLCCPKLESIKLGEAKGKCFQALWRSLGGYVFGLCLAPNFIISPIAAGFRVTIQQAGMSVMMTVPFGMLGLLLRGLTKRSKEFQNDLSAYRSA